MTRTELSQKICEGIFAVFGRPTQNPENWLYEQDYARGHVSVTESAISPRDAMRLCNSLESAIGHGVKVTTASRAAESYVFTIEFDAAKNESSYTDGKTTLTSGEKDGKKFVTDGKDVIATSDPDGLVNAINKATGSRFRKAEELLDERLKEASLALEGTGFTIERKDNTIRVSGPKSEVLAPICGFLPEGDEYYGSGIEHGDLDAVVLVLPAEIFGVEELLSFIDKAASTIISASEDPEPLTDDQWGEEISKAIPDQGMARRLSFVKDPSGLSLAMSDEKFAQAVASVRSFYGNDKAESILTLRLGARMARSIIEKLGAVKNSASEALMIAPGSRSACNVDAIIAGNMVTRK